MIFALDIMGVLLLSFWRKNHLNGDGVFRGHKTRDGLKPEIINTMFFMVLDPSFTFAL